MGDGRWRCSICGAGEYSKHSMDCVHCMKCNGLGWVKSFITCEYCDGVGRIPVPGSSLDPRRGVTHDLRDG